MADGLIHVVDDSTSFRESLRLMLEASGFTVQEHHGGRAFLDAIAAVPEGCALVDITMPDLDGLALQEEMKRRGIGVPVVIMTGNADVSKAVRAMKAGAVDFIEKPFALTPLLASIKMAQTRLPPSSPREGPQLAAFRSRLPSLTDREREILEAVVAGHATKTIAHRLVISPRTVDAHRARIGEKLGVAGVPNLIRLALAAGVTGR